MANKLARSVSIIGTGYTPLGDVRKSPEILNFTERELFSMACMEAMENGNIRATDIDAYYVGMSGPNYEAKIKSAAPFFGGWIGMKNKPTLFHDEGCGSAAFGLEAAVLAVASGKYDCVITGAVNINTCAPKAACYPPHLRKDLDNEEIWNNVYTGIDPAYQKPAYGSAGPVEAILIRYAAENGLSPEQIDEMFVNYLLGKRKEALLNPKALLVQQTYEEEAKMFGFDNPKDYLLSNRFNPPVGSYIRARFLGAGVDAASAIVVCATDLAKNYVDKPIEVAGISTIGVSDNIFCELPLISDKIMFEKAYEMAGIIDPYNQIDYLAVHDCPATMVIPVSEASGYIKKGEAWKYMTEGEMTFDGKKPISTTGGRTQSGHPRSPAFGIEVDEAVKQMRGENGERQIAVPPKTSVVWGGGAGYNMGICVLKSL